MNVVQLRPDRQPIGAYIRVGRQYHELEQLFSEGRLPIERAVFDACNVPRQVELVRSLRQNGHELVLETNVAELSAIGRFETSVRLAPWANLDRPMEPADFSKLTFVNDVASFAIKFGFSTILAPTHLLSGSKDRWFDIDRRTCINLRAALDAKGAQHIAIDYVLALTNAQFRDGIQRQELIEGLNGLPFENLWLRISGFGVHATAVGIQRHIAAVQDFQTLGKPIVADGVAGLTALALVAFAGVVAIAHGAGDMERFDASTWQKKPPEAGGGGQITRVLIASLDRQLTKQQIESVIAASGGRKLISCPPTCCRLGVLDAFPFVKGHYLRQRRGQLERLAMVPDLKRPYHLIYQEMIPSLRLSGELSRLRIRDPQVSKLFAQEHQRHERMLKVFEHLHTLPVVERPAKVVQARTSLDIAGRSVSTQWLQQ